MFLRRVASVSRNIKWTEQMTMSPDCKEIVGAVSGNEIQVFDMEVVGVCELAEGATERLSGVACYSDGKKIVNGGSDGCVRVWNAESGVLIGQPLDGPTGGVSHVAVSANGNHIASASQDNTVRVWNANSRQAVAQRPVTGEVQIDDVAVNKDGTKVVYSLAKSFEEAGEHCIEEVVEVWDVQSDTVATVITVMRTDYNLCVAMSVDWARVAFQAPDRSIVVWDVHLQHQLTSAVNADTGRITSLSFSEDGTRRVSTSWNDPVRVWDVGTGQAICKSFLHDLPVYHAQLDKCGLHIVSYDSRGYGRLWDVEVGHCAITSKHREWNATLQHLGLVAFDWRGLDAFVKHVSNVYEPTKYVNHSVEHAKVLSTMEKPMQMVRVGQSYYSASHGSTF